MKIERQLQGTLNTVFTELIKELSLDDRIEPYTVIEDGRADITLKKKNGRAIFFIELKDPTAKDGKSVFDSSVLIREVGRAQKLDIRYFGNCNFLACAFLDSEKIYEKAAVSEGFFTIADIARLSVNYSPNKEILSKLRNIASFYLDRAIEILESKPITFSPLDELFIFKIQKLIQAYANNITDEVWSRYNKNKQFNKQVQTYTQSQLWNLPKTYEEIENLTHISLLMLISKLIFYKTYVDNQVSHRLHPMKIPSEIKKPEEMEAYIWQYFEEFKEITGDFELLIGERADIIFQIPFVGDSVIDLVKDVLETEGHYNFSTIPFDIIGRIFEELIREDERHKLGQYFTPPHVIDLINAFAINNCKDLVFDPSCGSGTFLVRAYERKKQLCGQANKGTKHETLLDEIYGNDLSGYPAYLSMLNLAIRNTSKASYPRIINKDFFSITNNTKVELHDQQGNKEKEVLPKFDVVIGNPPYTRQEDIGAMNGTVKKEQIIKLIRSECGFEPSQRTSIYGYFFYHASAFLKDDGCLAFIVQNSWLETDYGQDMQKYFLRKYKIIAIMDSEIERFFPSASVNTSIVILRKEEDELERNNNNVKFVYFTAPLFETLEKFGGADALKIYIEDIEGNINEKPFRVNSINQQSLFEVTKWTQFLKAPKVYFDIRRKAGKKFVPLKSVVEDIKFGIKTGCNDFFIVEDVTDEVEDSALKSVVYNGDHLSSVKKVEQNNLRIVKNGYNELWLIEEQFLSPLLTSPKDVSSYKVRSSKLIFRLISASFEKRELKRDYPYLFEYIQWGERKHIHNGSSLASRKIWYDQGQKKISDLSFNYMINDVGRTYNVKSFTNNNFHNIYTRNNTLSIWLYMNSTISWLIQQLLMRSNLGDGAGKIETYELADFPTLDINLEKLTIDLGNTKSFKEEFGDLSTLESVNPERLKLDNEILKAIGFDNDTERRKVLLELYRSTNHIINARILKAQSLKGVKTQRNKVEFSVYVDQLKSILVENGVEAKNTFKFAKQAEKLVGNITSDNKLKKKILDTYWKEKFGEFFNQKEIAKKGQGSLF